MLKKTHKGSVAGLAMIGLALGWAAWEAHDDPSSSQDLSSYNDTSEKARSTKHRAVTSHLPIASATSRDIDPLEALDDKALARHREPSAKLKVISDEILLNGGKSLSPNRIATQLSPRQKLKAQRLGISGAEPELTLEHALLARKRITDDFIISTNQRVDSIRYQSLVGMDASQVETVYEYIESGNIPEGVSKSSHYWLVDELYISLRQQEKVPVDFVQRLSSIAADIDQYPVVRDYALQHLGHYHAENPSSAAEIEQALWTATNVKEGTIAGSSLIALNNAQEDRGLVNNYNLQEKAVEILKGEYTDEAKISALEILNNDEIQDVVLFSQKSLDAGDLSIAIQIKLENL